MRFFGFKWFGQTNPSKFLINILKYFSFLFQICRDIWLFVHSMYSQYTYRFIPRIRSIWTGKFSLNIYLIPRILQIRTESFLIFSVYEQIHSAYSQYTYRYIPHIWRMRPNNFECLDLNHFHYRFKGILLYFKKKYVCVQEDRRATRNDRLFGPSITK